MAYYHSSGAASALYKKFSRMKDIENRIKRLENERRYCSQEERDGIDQQLQLERDKLTWLKRLQV